MIRDLKISFSFEDLTDAEMKELMPLLKAVTSFQDKRKAVAP